MNVIDSYLDTLFAPYPNTAQMQRARRELRDMMEDKFHALVASGVGESQAVGTVIAEFGSLDEIAPVLGIDVEMGEAAGARQARETTAPPLDPHRALRYVDAVRASRFTGGVSTALFVLSPVPLLLLLAIFRDSTGMASGITVGIGIAGVLVIVLLGILLNMRRGEQLAEFEDIENGAFTTTARIEEVAHRLEAEHRRQSSRGWMIAISLWVLCAVPLIVLSLISEGNSPLPLIGVVLTITMVAIGLVVVSTTTWSDAVVETLIGEDPDEDDEDAVMHPVVRAITAVYWPVVVAVYLGWSFLGSAWSQSWLVWPIAGVLYAGLLALGRVLDENRAQSDRSASN
ncbi:hypothetical protein FCK90_08230 [Kocuria coralli]|uniref:Uncharacterized protein n=1 Tax=Kocuria coralli TaxID=1461025 RepID=A0A5J5KZF4_9MICC|nr:permease prefix domain 1-containing protein [Kocuria coralli]KAA9394226.1 hypothetical protein FCK90_08230 [Kocuria coralli]